MSWLHSTWLRWLGLVVLALAMAVYVASHLLQPAHPSPAQLSAGMKAQAALVGPAKLYAATCAHCHQPAEGSLIGPSLRGRGLPPAAVQIMVRNGVRGMPAFLPSQISDAQLAELALYISELPANATTSKTP